MSQTRSARRPAVRAPSRRSSPCFSVSSAVLSRRDPFEFSARSLPPRPTRRSPAATRWPLNRPMAIHLSLSSPRTSSIQTVQTGYSRDNEKVFSLSLSLFAFAGTCGIRAGALYRPPLSWPRKLRNGGADGWISRFSCLALARRYVNNECLSRDGRLAGDGPGRFPRRLGT